jgi:hypothetical protein
MIDPKSDGICWPVVSTVMAPYQALERPSHTAIPAPRLKIGEKIAASFVCADYRSVRSRGKTPGDVTTGRKYVVHVPVFALTSNPRSEATHVLTTYHFLQSKSSSQSQR